MDELPRVLPFGEHAFLVELGRDIDAATNARVVALASQLDGTDHGIAGLGRSVPAYASLLVPFDPALAEPATVSRRLRKLAEETVARMADLDARRIRIPVRYGDDDGPDLAAVAERAGISTSAVIELHTSVSYRVFMLGFAPGFAYLGSLPEPLRLPRRAEPRVRVPPGSVAIAAAQTAVYPHATAGGWHLLGRTDMQLWDPRAEEPALLRPGDLVRFVAV